MLSTTRTKWDTCNHMTVLGVDYGSKRVGIAASDEAEILAFPKSVLPNDERLISAIQSICENENVRLIVVGHSQNSRGEDNPIMRHVKLFKEALEEDVGLPVVFEQEFWSTVEAARFQGTVENLDASAAAIILQRFLDKQRSS